MTPVPRSTTIPLNDLKRAFDALSEPIAQACDDVLKSGWYVHGPQHAAFESEFAEFVGTPACVGVGNGTDALELSLRALAPGPGAEVVTVANAGMYASTAIRRAGLVPRYADVDPASLLMSVDTLRAVLDPPGIAVVVVTHLYGRMAPVDEIVAVCGERGIRVLEDCAQAVGAGGPGARAGSVGDAGAFSFYPTKNLGALGDGGAVVSRHPKVIERVRQLRQYGWTSKYHVGVDGGRNSRLDELQAAVLRVRLPFVDEWNARRRQIIGRYATATSQNVRIMPATDARHVGHLAVALCETGDRDRVRAALADADVQTDVHYPLPDHLQTPFASDSGPSLPVTEEVAGRVLSLPCFPELTDAEVSRVCQSLGAL